MHTNGDAESYNIHLTYRGKRGVRDLSVIINIFSLVFITHYLLLLFFIIIYLYLVIILLINLHTIEMFHFLSLSFASTLPQSRWTIKSCNFFFSLLFIPSHAFFFLYTFLVLRKSFESDYAKSIR